MWVRSVVELRIPQQSLWAPCQVSTSALEQLHFFRGGCPRERLSVHPSTPATLPCHVISRIRHFQSSSCGRVLACPVTQSSFFLEEAQPVPVRRDCSLHNDRTSNFTTSKNVCLHPCSCWCPFLVSVFRSNLDLPASQNMHPVLTRIRRVIASWHVPIVIKLYVWCCHSRFSALCPRRIRQEPWILRSCSRISSTKLFCICVDLVHSFDGAEHGNLFARCQTASRYQKPSPPLIHGNSRFHIWSAHKTSQVSSHRAPQQNQQTGRLPAIQESTPTNT